MKRITLVLIAVIITAGALFAFGGPGYGMRAGNRPYFDKGDYPMMVNGNGPYFDKGDYPMMMNGKPDFGHRRFMRRERGEVFHKILSSLDLSDKQLKQVDKIRTSYQSKRIEKLGKIRKLQFDKRTVLRQNQFDKAKTLNTQIYELKKEMGEIGINIRKDIRNILTDKQKQKLDEMILKRKFRDFDDEDDDK